MALSPQDEMVLIAAISEATSEAIADFTTKLAAIVQGSVETISEQYDVSEGDSWHEIREGMADIVVNAAVSFFNHEPQKIKGRIIELIDEVNAYRAAETAKKLLNDE